jgi:hypothetical protein
MVTLSPAGTASIESQTSLSDKQKAKDFIVVGYKEISLKLHNREGQYLSSLLSLLKVPVCVFH